MVDLTSMDTAWDFLDQEYPWPENYARITRTSSGRWRCDIEINGGDGPVFSGTATSAAIAIYLAAADAERRKRYEKRGEGER